VQPQLFGKYELLKCLGGGMSQVYIARDTLMDRTVAVKILSGSSAQDEGTRARFIREAQLAGNVIHDNIIRVYDFGEQGGQLFMVMELLQGEDLADAIKNKHVGGMENRIRIAEQIATAMEHIHSLQIVHRDLKPQNVFLSSSGVAKLMDFGIAKTDRTSLTQTGYSLGTPSYMSPEQVLGQGVNHLADIYSFGIVLFELITETKPLSAETLERVFWKILHEPVDLTPLRQSGAPDAIVNLVARCTQKEVGSRPQSFAEIRQTLHSALNGAPAASPAVAQTPPAQALKAPAMAAAAVPKRAPEPIPPEPVAVPAPRKTRWLWPIVATAVVAAAALGVYLFQHRTTPPAAVAKQAAEAAPPSSLALPSGDMALIPAGDFLFGAKNETRSTPAYYIDKTEVTNAAYAQFVKETGHAAPKGLQNARPEYPVVNVTIKDAREFARWAGKRLPTGVEWEKAGRGTDGRKYPWGNENRADVAVEGGIALHAANIDAAPSPYGILGLAGNVWELIDDQVTPSEGALKVFATLVPKATKDEPWCVIRGSSYLQPLAEMYESGEVPERFKAGDIGFRCVRDVRR
jgi:serine/threonine-protein kinase